MSPETRFPGTPRPRPKQPVPRGRLWVVVLAPFTSRGQFSPRLLMAWQAFYFTCFLAWKVVEALIHPKGVSESLTQNASLIVQLLFGLLGLVVSLLGMGTFQKIKLGDAAPAPGENDQSGNGPA